LSRSYGIDVGEFKGKSKETTVEKDLSFWVIALAALAILLEMAVMRWRREA
jgi:hypothetical protein